MNVLDLKKDLLDSFAKGEKPNYIHLFQSETDDQVEINIAKIPVLLYGELDKAKCSSKPPTSIFLSFASMYHWSDAKVTNRARQITEEVFALDILPALAKAIRAVGIEMKYDPGSSWATLEISDLKKFCEYDKLKSLT